MTLNNIDYYAITSNMWPLHVDNGNAKIPTTLKGRGCLPLWQLRMTTTKNKWHNNLSQHRPLFLHLCNHCKVVCVEIVMKIWYAFVSPYPNLQTNEKTYTLTCDHGQSWIIITVNHFTVFQWAWAQSAMNPLKITFETPFSAITTFNFFQKKTCVVPSSDCMSQYAMVYTLQYRLLYT